VLAEIVGNAIARQRLRANMTQAMVVSKLEIEPESVSRLEKGVFAPSLERPAHFASLLNCPVATFSMMKQKILTPLF
jgi:transcriptional regulator with XRE-family HTH domain